MPTDNIVYESRLHWIIFAWPVILFVVATAGLFVSSTLLHVSLLFYGVSAALFVVYYLSYKFSCFQILDGGIRLNTGIFVRESTNMAYKNIETIDIRQNVLGAILNYGTVVIIGTGGTRNVLQHLQNPLTCRRHIEKFLS